MISRSFTAISPYLRPAPDTTWAPRARWYAIKTEGGREARVAKLITELEHQVFLPVELRARRKIRGRQRDSVEVPLLPRIVFAMTALDGWPAIRNLDHVTGFECNPEGFPEPIPDDQMETFRRTHGEWLADQQKRLALGKVLQGRGARSRRRSMPFREALIELQRKMTGDMG